MLRVPFDPRRHATAASKSGSHLPFTGTQNQETALALPWHGKLSPGHVATKKPHLGTTDKVVVKSSSLQVGTSGTKAFEEVKEVISRKALLTFPQFDKSFHIYTDASDYQPGAVITQEGKPLAFYSRKMNKAQQNCTTGEQELLSIVETLKEFRNILLGQKVIIHTDHKNIVHGNLSNDRIVRWRLRLEEFGPECPHIAGKDNVVADALSRPDMDIDNDNDSDSNHIPKDGIAQIAATCMCMLVRDESCDIPSATDPAFMAECFLNNVAKENELAEFPVDPKGLYKSQRKDKNLMRKMKTTAKRLCHIGHCPM